MGAGVYGGGGHTSALQSRTNCLTVVYTFSCDEPLDLSHVMGKRVERHGVCFARGICVRPTGGYVANGGHVASQLHAHERTQHERTDTARTQHPAGSHILTTPRTSHIPRTSPFPSPPPLARPPSAFLARRQTPRYTARHGTARTHHVLWRGPWVVAWVVRLVDLDAGLRVPGLECGLSPVHQAQAKRRPESAVTSDCKHLQHPIRLCTK